MKNVFSYPGEKLKNPKCNGEQFVTARLDESFRRAVDEAHAKVDKAHENATLPFWANAIAWLFFVAFAIVAVVVLRTASEYGFAEAFVKLPLWLLIVGAAGFVVWLVLKLIELRNGKRDEETGDYDRALENLANINQTANDMLGVPPDFESVDVMAYYYKPAKGKLDGEYLNEDMKLFCKDDCLCLADIGSVYSFPIKDFVRYYLNSEMFPLAMWNKKENYDEGEYLQYGIKTKYTDMACLCYSLQFVSGSEVYEIIFPEYELEHFQSIVDVPVEFDE